MPPARVSLSPHPHPRRGPRVDGASPLRSPWGRPWVEGAKEEKLTVGAGVTLASTPRGLECELTGVVSGDSQSRARAIEAPPHPGARAAGVRPASRRGRDPGSARARAHPVARGGPGSRAPRPAVVRTLQINLGPFPRRRKHLGGLFRPAFGKVLPNLALKAPRDPDEPRPAEGEGREGAAAPPAAAVPAGSSPVASTRAKAE